MPASKAENTSGDRQRAQLRPVALGEGVHNPGIGLPRALQELGRVEIAVGQLDVQQPLEDGATSCGGLRQGAGGRRTVCTPLRRRFMAGAAPQNV
jgi:hypothetical protein